MILEIRNLTKKYGKLTALNDVTLNIEENVIFGLIGQNGAGKSTLLGMLTSLVKPTSGEIYIHGKNIKENSMEVKKLIGFLPHETIFYENKTPVDHMIYFGMINGLSRLEAEERGLVLLHKVGLEEKRNEPVVSLSNGMKKKLGIAQALIHDPKIVILDEPFSGLDINAKVNIRETIKSLYKDITIILSSHNLYEIEKLCKRIAFLEKGKIVLDNEINKLKLSTNKISIEFERLTEQIIEKFKKIKTVKSVDINDNIITLHFKLKKDHSNIINKFLHQNNLRPLSIKKGISIEDLFIENL